MHTIYRNTRGFTLVELLITIAIAGIIMAIGVPSLRDFITANRLTGNVNSMVGLINYARSEAIVRNQPVIICPKEQNNNTCINSEFWAEYEIQVFVDVDGNNQRGSNDILLKTIPAFDNTGTLFRVNKNSTPQYLKFESLGYSTSSASIAMYAEGNSDYQFKYGRKLCISKPGRVRIISYQNNCS